MTAHCCDSLGPGGSCSYCGPRTSTAHDCPLCNTTDPAFWAVWDDDPEEDL